MTAKGADFSDIEPRDSSGNLNLSFVTLPEAARGLDTGVIFQVTANNVYRLGQQLFFWLGIANPETAGGNFLTRVRLKPWWARPGNEYRQAFGGNGLPGAAQVLPIDRSVFGVGAAGGLLDNRYVWVPSPKRQDTTPETATPPGPAPAQHSDSILLDDLWTIDMPDPTVAAYAGKFVAPQIVSRWVSILYPAFGFSLGFTFETVVADPDGDAVPLSLNLSWAQGTFGSGRIQESVG